MFDFIADGLTIITAILFPIYASYKALSTSDPALLHPWLIYWVCFAILTTTSSLLYPFLSYMPFYSWIRFSIHLYLLLPGEQQGAAYIYRLHIEPWLKEHDRDIEQLISTSHDRIKTAGLEYLRQLVRFVKAQLLGMPPEAKQEAAGSTTTAQASRSSRQQQQQAQSQSYAQSLLARFSLPSARPAAVASATSAAAEGAGTAADGTNSGGANAALYGLLSSALQAAAATATASKTTSPSRSTSGSGIGGTAPESTNVGGANVALYGLLSSALQAATASRTSSASRSASGSGIGGAAATAPLALNTPADSARYAEGLSALLKAFDGQAGTSTATESATGNIRPASPTPSPPAGFEAIEHEDARMDGSVVTTPEKPKVLKRRSTSGGWGSWVWGAKKEGKVEGQDKEKVVVEEKVEGNVDGSLKA